ncbi:hypothetical protein JM93_02607 [Roseibium hamelinense]|uniref:Uncharacterized protein n=1 Tax=Roseibium hamelinense TaxID=150831 RepID=A0A562T162_9HYPH|nr:hypothetical protein [Roseibium hamelinense]TWI87365.1 hypothetical protein JM93_02607 [Roseibium hamelinense]
MLLGDPVDTLMNLGTFAFIGFVFWILVRPGPSGAAPPDDPAGE